MIGDVPFNVFPRAISAARVNLCITRRSHATVYASSSCRPFELAACRRGDRGEPVQRDRALVRAGPRADRRRRRGRGGRRRTATCSTIPAQAEELGRRARERVLDEHTYRAPRAAAARAGRPPVAAVSEAAGAPPRRLAARGLRRIAIVPAYNEELNVGRVIDELRAFDPGLDVVVVSDGSTDRTAEVAAAHGAHVLQLPFNLGIGGAVQTGFRYAWEEGYELAVRVDGDGQHDPAQLGVVLAPGARRRGRHRRRLALRRRRERLPLVAPRGASASACSRGSSRAIARQQVTDPTSGFQALNRRAHRAVRRRLPARLPRGRGDRDGDPAPRCGSCEVPVTMREREHGRSSITALARSTTWSRSCSRSSSGSSAARSYPLEDGMTPLKVSIAGAIASLAAHPRRLRADPRRGGCASATRCSGSRPASCCSCSRPGAAG